jgi:UDP-N-acetylmuramate-alanine ligase
VDAVCAAAQPGDMILTLGAGSVSQLGEKILAKLGEARHA